MYKYYLELKLVNPNVCYENLYSKFHAVFSEAVTTYNRAALRNPKQILEIKDSNANTIAMIISSREKLPSPGKALKKFYTQLLINDTFKQLLYNERLFYTSDWSEISDDENNEKISEENSSDIDLISLLKEITELMLDSRSNESSKKKLSEINKIVSERY